MKTKLLFGGAFSAALVTVAGFFLTMHAATSVAEGVPTESSTRPTLAQGTLPRAYYETSGVYSMPLFDRANHTLAFEKVTRGGSLDGRVVANSAVIDRVNFVHDTNMRTGQTLYSVMPGSGISKSGTDVRAQLEYILSDVSGVAKVIYRGKGYGAKISPGGERIALTKESEELVILDSSGAQLASIDKHAFAPVFSPSGRYVAFWMGSLDGLGGSSGRGLGLYDSLTGEVRTLQSSNLQLYPGPFTADERMLYVRSGANVVSLSRVDVSSGASTSLVGDSFPYVDDQINISSGAAADVLTSQDYDVSVTVRGLTASSTLIAGSIPAAVQQYQLQDGAILKKVGGIWKTIKLTNIQ